MKSVVSINIPCYNRKEMLRECVQSFIDQTFTDFEIVVADDGSEDDLTFVASMDKRVKYVRQEHIGIARAFNLALDNSVGEYIMPFGSDDLATPELLIEQLTLLEIHKRYDVAYCNHWTMRNDGKKHRKLCMKTLSDKDAYQAMLERQYIPHGGSLWKKDKMPRYDESLESAVDWELFLAAMESGVRFKHRRAKLWIHRTGHPREERTERQLRCCDIILRRRGYYFNKELRKGIKL